MTAPRSSERCDLLQGLGLSLRIAEAVDQLFVDNFVDDLSDQSVEQIKSMPEGLALQAIQKFRASDLTTVLHRSAFFLGILRSMRNGGSNFQSGFNGVGPMGGGFRPRPPPSKTGPNPDALQAILNRTGYSHEVSSSLRRYGGPPPGWNQERPTGTEVFMGKIPQDIFEDDLIPLFEQCGRIYELRVITDSEGLNRGYGFVTFCNREDAKLAVSKFNGYEIPPSKRRIVVKHSVQFTRLFMGGIPNDKTREDIRQALAPIVDKLTDVIVQENNDASKANRGFCFLEFESYFDAAAARKKLMSNKTKITAWNNLTKFVVDWAIPQDNPDEEAVSSSTSIDVNGLTESISEDDLKTYFKIYGEVRKVVRKSSHATITYADSKSAHSAAQSPNAYLKGVCLEIKIHIPLSSVAKRMMRAIKGPMMRGMRGRRFNGGGFQPAPFPRRAGAFTRSKLMPAVPPYGPPMRGGFRGRGMRGGGFRGRGGSHGNFGGSNQFNQFGSSFTHF